MTRVPDTAQIAASTSFQLDAGNYTPGADIHVKFSGPVSSKSGHQAWMCVADAGSAPSSYSAWDYVKDGAQTFTLKAPTQPGKYEVRMHTDYPVKSYNIKYSVKLTVGASTAPKPGETPLAQQTFLTSATTVHPGDKAEVAFPAPLHAAKGERFWLTIAPADAPDTSWGAYDYVADGATSMSLAVPTKPGNYELRLHANYPTKSTNVVHRETIHVE